MDKKNGPPPGSEIKESGELLKVIWENSRDGMCLTNENGTIVNVTQAFCNLAGKKESELKGKPLKIIFAGHEGEEILGNYVESRKKEKSPVYFEEKFKFWNNREYWLGVQVNFPVEHREEYRILYNFSNITDRKKKENQNEELQSLNVALRESNQLIKDLNNKLIRAHSKAVKSNKSKSAFLANMSHEIRTPMNGILGFTELLKKPDIPPEKSKLFLHIIEQSGRRMLNIIDDLIDMSKIEAGLVELNHEPTNINKLLRQLFDFFKPEADRAGIGIYLHTPMPDNKSIFITDPCKLEQVMSNLIKNSLKFTAKGKIDIGYDLEGAEIRLFVKDTGIGISKEHQDKIFTRFWKKDTRQNKEYDGSGLGLAICKSFVELMGGRIRVDSEEGKGSEFFVSFPLTESASEKSNTGNSAGTPLIPDYPTDIKILIAEDDRFSEEYFKAILEPWISEAIVAGSGTEAVKLCRENDDIDIVLMDIKMSNMDGLQATREIRKFNKTIPVIAQSAYALEGDREKALKAGCNRYITKPVKANHLRNVILECLNESTGA